MAFLEKSDRSLLPKSAPTVELGRGKPGRKGKTFTRAPGPTVGSQALAEQTSRIGRRQTSIILGLSKTMVTYLAGGHRAPSAETAQAIETSFSIPVAAWREPAAYHQGYTRLPAEKPPPPPKGKGRKPPPPEVEPEDDAPLVPLGTTLEEAIANAQRLRKIAESTANDPHESARVAAQAGGAFTAALRQVSILRGEEEVSEARLAKSPIFQAHIAKVLGVLKNFPEALDAVVQAMENK
jgi:hypothetical protein